MFKKFIKRALLGFIYGIFIGQTILILESLFKGDGNFHPVSAYLLAHTNTTIAAVIAQYFITGIIGVTFAGTTVIFEMDRWTVPDPASSPALPAPHSLSASPQRPAWLVCWTARLCQSGSPAHPDDPV